MQASAMIAAESSEADYPVTYSGDTDRLAEMPQVADYPFIRFSLHQLATRPGATVKEETRGHYYRHAA